MPYDLDGKTPWEFACRWYDPEDIARAIAQAGSGIPFAAWDKIPSDVLSKEFAVWLTEQYRLAMSKGIQIGMEARNGA